MEINMTGYHHNLNYKGITGSITISYNKNEGNNSFSGSVVFRRISMEIKLFFEEMYQSQINKSLTQYILDNLDMG